MDQTVRRAIEETWAVLTSGTEMANPALFLARLADLARSNTFLWAGAGDGCLARWGADQGLPIRRHAA